MISSNVDFPFMLQYDAELVQITVTATDERGNVESCDFEIDVIGMKSTLRMRPIKLGTKFANPSFNHLIPVRNEDVIGMKSTL